MQYIEDKLGESKKIGLMAKFVQSNNLLTYHKLQVICNISLPSVEKRPKPARKPINFSKRCIKTKNTKRNTRK